MLTTTVASPFTQDQMRSVVDDGAKVHMTPQPWRKLAVRVFLQPFLWAAWIRSKVILREDW